MSQADYDIANQAGAAFRAELNAHLAAIVSNNSGATAPATTFAYQWWADTATGLLKIRNAANSAWVTVGTLASANLGLASLASPTFTGTVTIPTLALTNDLSIANGGTGQSTAAGAFTALKQTATETATGVVELATSAESTGWSATPSGAVVCTPSSLSEVRSYFLNGYQRLPGGLLIQWGRSTNRGDWSGGTTTLDIVFPLAFPNFVLHVAPTLAVSGGNSPNGITFWDIAGTSLSTARVKCSEFSSWAQTSDNYVQFFAIGY